GEMRKRKAPYAGAARPAFATAEQEAAFKNARNYGGAEFRAPEAAFAHQHGTARLNELPPPAVPRAEVIDEVYGAVVQGRPPLHDGTWAMATLEVLLA